MISIKKEYTAESDSKKNYMGSWEIINQSTLHSDICTLNFSTEKNCIENINNRTDEINSIINLTIQFIILK